MLDQILRLYAPFAALMGIAFWVGVLSARVITLEREERARKERERIEGDKHDGMKEKLTILETTMQFEVKSIKDAIERQGAQTTMAIDKIGRDIAGINRTIANAIQKGALGLKEFGQQGQDHHD